MAIHCLSKGSTDALLRSLRDERHLVSGGTRHGQLHLVASDRAFVDDGAVLDVIWKAIFSPSNVPFSILP